MESASNWSDQRKRINLESLRLNVDLKIDSRQWCKPEELPTERFHFEEKIWNICVNWLKLKIMRYEDISSLRENLFSHKIWQIRQVLRSNVSSNVGLMKKILEVIESNETGLSKVGKHPSDSNHQILQKQLKEFQTSSKTTSMRTA